MLRSVRGAVTSFINGLNSGNNSEAGARSPRSSPKYPYSRPRILDLLDDEIPTSADKTTRPVLTPKNSELIPFRAGYAEVINAGKSELNEDQAACGIYSVEPFIKHASAERKSEKESDCKMEFAYFAIFDGHAGADAAVVAANCLHKLIQANLGEAIGNMPYDNQPASTKGSCLPELAVSLDDVVVGAVEASFMAMDEHIGYEIATNHVEGGCAVIVAIFYNGSVYIANAGDCRAVLYNSRTGCHQLSFDLTPETERQRLQAIASHSSQKAVQDEFTPLQFRRRLTRKDLGTRVLYRSSATSGWMYKTVMREDLLCPLIAGEGKKARLMGTIGVSRGFGDHSLKVFDTSISVKPFLSPVPNVTTYRLSDIQADDDCVIIMGSDGLWDVITNELSAEIAKNVLSKHGDTEPNRYKLLAHELTYQARGAPTSDRSWVTTVGGSEKAASLDDISCFVIPLHNPTYDGIP